MLESQSVTPMGILQGDTGGGGFGGGGGLIAGLLLGSLLGRRGFGGGDCDDNRSGGGGVAGIALNSLNNLTTQLQEISNDVNVGNRDLLISSCKTGDTVQQVGFGLAQAIASANRDVLLSNAALSTQLCNTESDIVNNLTSGFAATNAAITNALIEQLECCCEVKEAIAQQGFNTLLGFKDSQLQAAENTCRIISAIHEDGEETRELINANTQQSLRDEISQLRASVAFNNQESRLNNLAVQVGTVGSLITQIPTLVNAARQTA